MKKENTAKGLMAVAMFIFGTLAPFVRNINGDPDKPLHCKVEGKRRSTTKIVVTQDFSPALDSSTTGCNQGLI